MSGNPVFVDDVPPEKADARAYLVYRFGSADEVRGADLSGTWCIFIDELRAFFRQDTSDTTSADDSETVIIDDAGNRWKILAGNGAVDSVNGQTGVVSLRASDIPYSDDSPSISISEAIREKLSANRTYFVDDTNGSDSNSGLASGSGNAFATIQKALDVCATIDFNGFTVTIQLADGTYTAANSVRRCVGQAGESNLIIAGNSSTPGNVALTQSGSFVPTLSIPTNTGCLLKDCEIAASSGYAVYVGGGVFRWSNVRFGTTGQYHVFVEGGRAEAAGDYTISGDATCHWVAGAGGSYVKVQSRTITASGSRAFTQFANAQQGGSITSNGCTFSGTVTGARYSATLAGIIQTFGSGANYFPGNSAGTATSPGAYA
jgi:hypothetical protein